MKKILAWTVGVLLLANSTFAQAPKVQNAAFSERAVSGNTESFFQTLVQQQVKPAWIAYMVAAVPGRVTGWSSDGQYYYGDGAIGCGPSYLEGRPPAVAADGQAAPVGPRGDNTLFVLFRAENGKVNRIRVYSPACELEAGGLPFIWLTGVAAADSVRILKTFARIPEREPATSRTTNSYVSSAGNYVTSSTSVTRPGVNMARTAVTAIALHDDGSADAALVALIAPEQDLELRKQAAYWLGAARGERGFAALAPAAEKDANAEFRRQAALGLSQSTAAGAVDVLLRMARHDADPSVRGQSLVWLAQKAGKKAIGALTDAIENDPEAQVKERAVFALSRLPKDEGVPLLIQLARTNRDPKVRQRAMFWLGESNDERAVSFFEELLRTK